MIVEANDIVSWILNFLGLCAGFLLFFRNPSLQAEATPDDGLTLSVIIPARNEAANLPNLLRSLREQTRQADEIICVDDDSCDGTADIAREYGVTVIQANARPDGWIGKSWACQTGAQAAKGRLLLFLDADVRLNRTALSRLLAVYRREKTVLSVQPYHQVRQPYEYGSLFFNLALVGANGVGWPFRQRHIGLFGPVILISRTDYQTINGHAAVRSSIVDDLALGEALQHQGIPFRLYLGGQDICFRMYGGGWRQLWQGWSKNFAAGVARTPWPLLILMILWITACLAIAGNLAGSLAGTLAAAFNASLPVIAGYGPEWTLPVAAGLYALCAGQIIFIARRIGSFRAIALLVYPIWLMMFLAIFTYALFRKVFCRSAIWKGRKIKL